MFRHTDVLYDSDHIILYKFLFYILNLEIAKLIDPSNSCEQCQRRHTPPGSPALVWTTRSRWRITDDGVTLGHTTRVLQCLCLAGECAAGPVTRGKGHIRTTFAPDTLHIKSARLRGCAVKVKSKTKWKWRGKEGLTADVLVWILGRITFRSPIARVKIVRDG